MMTINNLNNFFFGPFEIKAPLGLNPIKNFSGGQLKKKNHPTPALKAGVGWVSIFSGFWPDGTKTCICSFFLFSFPYAILRNYVVEYPFLVVCL